MLTACTFIVPGLSTDASSAFTDTSFARSCGEGEQPVKAMPDNNANVQASVVPEINLIFCFISHIFMI